MRKIVLLFIATLVVFACTEERQTNMTVKGQIKGLKKGKLYLQKMNDTLLVSVDSLALNGSDLFELKDFVSSPVLYYLTFDGNTSERSILFFGEEGEIEINDNVENFGLSPEIKGSKNQEILDKYNKVRRRFQDENLELIKRNFEAQKAKDDAQVKKVEDDYKRLERRKILYTANFAISNAAYEVAPYLALTEMYNATLPLLDTVHNALSDKVKNSIYGKKFQVYLDNIKKEEKE